MAGNNSDPWGQQPNPNVTGNPSPWNSPNQPAGQDWYQPPSTMTGYSAKYPIPPVDPQAPVAPGANTVPYGEAYRQAERRVQARLRFYKHLASYLIVNAFLWIIAVVSWIGSGSGSIWSLIWPIWVSVFWGIGLVSDYIQTFSLNESTRQRMIEDEMRRMRH